MVQASLEDSLAVSYTSVGVALKKQKKAKKKKKVENLCPHKNPAQRCLQLLCS